MGDHDRRADDAGFGSGCLWRVGGAAFARPGKNAGNGGADEVQTGKIDEKATSLRASLTGTRQ